MTYETMAVRRCPYYMTIIVIVIIIFFFFLKIVYNIIFYDINQWNLSIGAIVFKSFSLNARSIKIRSFEMLRMFEMDDEKNQVNLMYTRERVTL